MGKNLIKQVIVVRKDLNMKKGKLAAQVAHASLGCILKLMKYESDTDFTILRITPGSALELWLNGKFTKICLSVNSEQELSGIYKNAQENELTCCLITDAGDTVFGGVPTKTCVGIGPDFGDKIDEITKNLKLL